MLQTNTLHKMPRGSHANDVPSLSTEKVASATLVPEDVVAKRAYDKFIARGSVHGFDQQDWAEAERALIAELMADRATKMMLRSVKGLEHYVVKATDGNVGRVVNVLFDDEHWVVRYLVVETTAAISRPRVLISPVFFREVDWSTHTFNVALTMDKVRHSPDLDTDQPVSRQHEREYSGYYGYSNYWGYLAPWGASSYPALLGVGKRSEERGEHPDKGVADLHLRSAKEVSGYHIECNDGTIGHIEDFIVDDDSWTVRYLVVDTSRWPMGKKVLVAPRWANRISWMERKVHLDLSRETIKSSPEWNAMDGVNRAYEVRLYDYYGRPSYWSSDLARAAK